MTDESITIIKITFCFSMFDLYANSLEGKISVELSSIHDPLALGSPVTCTLGTAGPWNSFLEFISISDLLFEIMEPS